MQIQDICNCSLVKQQKDPSFCVNVCPFLIILLSQVPLSTAMQNSSGSIPPAGIFIVAVSIKPLMYH